jgi:hypothetical protein
VTRLDDGGSELQRLLWAIAQQESGGNYSANNGIAVGKYQVLKSNVPSWTKDVLGHSLTWQQFLADPSAQDQVAAAKIGAYYQQYGARGAASAWYSGNPKLSESTRPQSGGPSIKAYVDQVIARMGKAPAGGSTGAPAAGTGGAGGGSGVSPAGLLSFPSDVVGFFSSATDSLSATADFARAFFQPSTYVRAGSGAIGTILIIAGIVFLAKEARE